MVLSATVSWLMTGAWGVLNQGFFPLFLSEHDRSYQRPGSSKHV